MARYGKVEFEDFDNPGIIRFRSPENEGDFCANMSDEDFRSKHRVSSFEIFERPEGWSPEYAHYGTLTISK
jgi:hypothetical protein